MRNIHLSNAAGRDTTIPFTTLKPPERYRLGLPDRAITFRRYLATTPEGLNAALVQRFGTEEYGQHLVDGDPEIDLEVVGRAIGETNVVWLSSDGEVMHAAPEVVEIRYDALGEETDRREPKDVEANINDERPLAWTGRKMSRREVVRKFVFARTVQIRHTDGLTYDYLHGMAAELDEEDAVVLVGGGAKGRAPLVFTTNGTPYRAFLEGRVDGDRYQLLLHLSNMELKRPGA